LALPCVFVTIISIATSPIIAPKSTPFPALFYIMRSYNYSATAQAQKPKLCYNRHYVKHASQLRPEPKDLNESPFFCFRLLHRPCQSGTQPIRRVLWLVASKNVLKILKTENGFLALFLHFFSPNIAIIHHLSHLMGSAIAPRDQKELRYRSA